MKKTTPDTRSEPGGTEEKRSVQVPFGILFDLRYIRRQLRAYHEQLVESQELPMLISGDIRYVAAFATLNRIIQEVEDGAKKQHPSLFEPGSA